MAEKKSTEIRRDEIIKASLQLIEEHGLDNLNVADIAAAVKLVPSAIYRHFGGKEEIIGCLIDFVERSLRANVAKAAGSGRDAAGKLELLYELHTEFLKTQPAIPQILFSLLATNKTPGLKQRMLAVIGGYMDEVRKIVSQGQQQGDLALSIDPMAAAVLFIGMIQPLTILSQTGNRLIDQFKRTMWAVYLRGISR